MTHIKLQTPKPRKAPKAFSEFPYALGASRQLPQFSEAKPISPMRLFMSRRTSAPRRILTDVQLGTVLWTLGKTFEYRMQHDGRVWQHRIPPSAGGCHPIDLLVFRNRRLFLYDCICHRLHRVENSRRIALDRLFRHFAEAATGTGDIIVLAAQFDRTMSRYAHGESLVWRDAGALIATCYLACAAHDLSCTALGPTGGSLLNEALNGKSLVEGVGGCLVGQR